MTAKHKEFVAVSFEAFNGKIAVVNTSIGQRIVDESGLSVDQVFDFLFSLRRVGRSVRRVFVSYAISADMEVLFGSLTDIQKDKLFQSHTIRKQAYRIEFDQEKIDEDLYRVEPDSQEFEQLTFEGYVNKLALAELFSVKIGAYDVKFQNGKQLTLSAKKKQFTLFDVFGFFRKPLRVSVERWLGEVIELLDREHFRNAKTVDEIVELSSVECKYIAQLVERLDGELRGVGIQLRNYHGAGAVSSWILNAAKAKTNDRATTQFHNYRYKRQLGDRLHSSMMQAYYGGRVEQLKIGTVSEGVYVYDINSAYAFAISLLPFMVIKPQLARSWIPEPFSFWRCEYDFTKANPYFGLLPNRELKSNTTLYKTRGSGFFWQPEISYILQHHPECIEVFDGYYIPYERAPFADFVAEMYQLRQRLQAAGSPLEKVFKIALSSIYGKFCQSQGKGYFYNMFYAGFVTSVTRRQLLEATRGKEHTVICFLTDAIHTTEPLDIPVTDALGHFKAEAYSKGEYIDAGVYRLTSANGKTKEATRGFRVFDFDLAMSQLAARSSYDALLELFVGHNLHSLRPTQYRKYLQLQHELKRINPLESNGRRFTPNGASLQSALVDSEILTSFNGLPSAKYLPFRSREVDGAKDAIMAGRVIL